MICKKCGEQLPDNARFCGSCGERIQGSNFVENSLKRVVLINVGRNKISVIKEIRLLLGVGLAEAKAICDQTPSLIKDNISNNEAERIQIIFKSVGADVKIQ